MKLRWKIFGMTGWLDTLYFFAFFSLRAKARAKRARSVRHARWMKAFLALVSWSPRLLLINPSKESRGAQIAFLFLSRAIFNSVENLLFLGTTRTEISACKPNVKLFRLLGSSSFHAKTPLSLFFFKHDCAPSCVCRGLQPLRFIITCRCYSKSVLATGKFCLLSVWLIHHSVHYFGSSSISRFPACLSSLHLGFFWDIKSAGCSWQTCFLKTCSFCLVPF